MTGTTSLLGISFSDRDWMESFFSCTSVSPSDISNVKGEIP